MKTIILTLFLSLLLGSALYAQTDKPTDPKNAKTSAETTPRRAVFRATKEQITQVQTMLTKSGKYTGAIDGKFNDDFRKSIKAFQAENELKKTGTLNRATLEKIGVELTDKQKEYPINPNSYDTSKNDEPEKPKTERKRAFRPTKDQIAQAQTKLKAEGKFQGEVTGKYSDDFRASLKEFQEAGGLKKTGRLDQETLEAMGIELTAKQMGKDDDESNGSRKSFRVNSDQINKAQTILKDKGMYAGEITGKYNDDFQNSVKDFQTANGLKRKGSLNRATLEKMGIELTESQKEIPVNPDDYLKTADGSSDAPRRIFRATKDQIMRVQAMLKEKGLYDGEQTGKLNPETCAGIREWQEQNNVKKTGTLNKETLEAMGIELTDKQKEM